MSLPFAPANYSVWNQPVGDARKAANSDQVVAALLSQCANANGPYGNTGINSHAWSVPVYEVPANQPKQPVTLRAKQPLGAIDQALADQWAAVPIPDNPVSSPGSDGSLLIWDHAADAIYEFWQWQAPGYTDANGVTYQGYSARWGGVMTEVSRNPGYFPTPYGESASSLSMLGGLIRPAEVQAGKIPHALAMAIPKPKAGAWVFPAQRCDGGGNDPTSIVLEGMHFRLDVSFNVEAWWAANVQGHNGDQFVRLLMHAWKDYGIIIRDRSASVCFYCEDVQSSTGAATNPWVGQGGWMGAQPWAFMPLLPWDQLILIDPLGEPSA